MLPWSSQQLHITPHIHSSTSTACGSCAKTAPTLLCCLRDAFWPPLFQHLYLCYPAGAEYSSLHQPSGLPFHGAISPKLQLHYLSGLKLIQIFCASVWGQNCLCSAGCKCTPQSSRALPTASSNFTLFCLCWSGWVGILFIPAT